MNLRLATLQRIVVLAVIGLAIMHLAVLRPLAQKVREERAPLQSLSQSLARATVEAGLPTGTDFLALTEHLSSLRAASVAFSAAEREARPRLEHPLEVQQRLDEPFQFVEFLNESQRRIEELTGLAQAGRVSLTAGLARGFPRYQVELARPELLWVQLATVNRVLRTAIRAGVRDVSEVSVEPLPLLDSGESGFAPGLTGTTNVWSTLRVHLTVNGTMDALGRLLVALALTPEELKRTGLPEDLAARPALFLDHLMLRRTQLDAPEQAQLDLVVSTVVPAELP
jgi:hypothetical protein